MMDPFYTISLCGASMLTHQGRCFTFDSSADGYVRGEAHACLYMKQSVREDFSRLNMLCASNMNQDGRSASMTAPHGPSQQECIRACMKEGGISATMIQLQELHGTGTALGDPIEVGALRATMMATDGIVRERALVKTSSKSNIGHTELSAGLCGLMKCVLLGVSAVGAPNVHLRLLNPHIDTHAYPVYFASEIVDQGQSVAFNGVSSFGFGGSNARADVWARALNGHRNTNPEEFSFDLSRQRIDTMNKVFAVVGNFTHDIRAIAARGGLVQYDGDYLVGTPYSSDNEFFLEGSFNGWGKGNKMIFNEEKGTYSFPITLGDTRVEHFRINVNGHDDASIFPAAQCAMQDQIRILGPGTAPPGHYFVIDGRENCTAQGTVYNVEFWYDAQTRQKRVQWAPTIDEATLRACSCDCVAHRYFVVGSWNRFEPKLMRPTPTSDPGLYIVEVRIGLTGTEEFNFLRDGKADEVIYPAHHRALSGDVPVRGPSVHGKGKYFGINGHTGDRVTIQLQVWDGEVLVTIDSLDTGMVTFRNMPGIEGKRYFLVGEWNNRFPVPLRPANKEKVFEARMVMPHDGKQRFHIVEDEDERQAIHPEMPNADQGISYARGPDADGEGLDWAIVAGIGQVVVITLDMSQTDGRQMVTWAPQ